MKPRGCGGAAARRPRAVTHTRVRKQEVEGTSGREGGKRDTRPGRCLAKETTMHEKELLEGG
eukprot:5121941-Alexandrium_andersonii.AAC.1